MIKLGTLWFAFRHLRWKQSMPNVEITALVPSYTAPLLPSFALLLIRLLLIRMNKKIKTNLTVFYKRLKMSNLMRYLFCFRLA